MSIELAIVAPEMRKKILLMAIAISLQLREHIQISALTSHNQYCIPHKSILATKIVVHFVFSHEQKISQFYFELFS